MHVRVEVRQIPEGLHEQDQAGPRPGGGRGVRIGEQPRGDAAQLAQPRPLPAEDRAKQPGQREHVLPVRYGLEDVLPDPFAVQEHALLVAARAEIPRLAGVREQPVVPAGVAVDARKAVMRVAALDEAFDDLCLNLAAQPARVPQFGSVALGALPQRACARIAWAVQAASAWRHGAPALCPSRPARASRSHPGGNAPAGKPSTLHAAPVHRARLRQRPEANER